MTFWDSLLLDENFLCKRNNRRRRGKYHLQYFLQNDFREGNVHESDKDYIDRSLFAYYV